MEPWASALAPDAPVITQPAWLFRTVPATLAVAVSFHPVVPVCSFILVGVGLCLTSLLPTYNEPGQVLTLYGPQVGDPPSAPYRSNIAA